MKFVVAVSPTQAPSNQNCPSSGTGVLSEGTSEQSSSSLAESIVFDGRTFTVTFSHVSGM